MTRGITLDAGALIAYERNVRHVVALLRRAVERELALVVPAGAIGQVWRNGRKQARLAGLLASDRVEVEPLDDRRAREAGQLCGARKTHDVIDASVVLCARARRHKIMTSDPEDLAQLAPEIELIVV
jgi:hypothetical protein